MDLRHLGFREYRGSSPEQVVKHDVGGWIGTAAPNFLYTFSLCQSRAYHYPGIAAMSSMEKGNAVPHLLRATAEARVPKESEDVSVCFTNSEGNPWSDW